MIESLVLAAALHAPSQPMHPEARRESSRAARDLRGYEPSLYRGRYYRPSQESWRRCVMEREAENIYTVIGGGGNAYHGVYQFHDGNWRRGLTYMMAGESRRTHDGLRDDAHDLRSLPIAKWNRYWQDRAFFTALNYRGTWSGKAHWAGGRWAC